MATVQAPRFTLGAFACCLTSNMVPNSTNGNTAMETKIILKNIASIAKSSKLVRELTQETAIAILTDISNREDGDCTLLTKLAEALGAGSRRDSFIAWIAMSTPVDAVKDAKGTAQDVFTYGSNKGRHLFKVNKGTKDSPMRPWNLANLAKCNWWEAKAEAVLMDLDFEKDLARLVKKYEDALASEEVSEGKRKVVNLDRFQTLRTLVAQQAA